MSMCGKVLEEIRGNQNQTLESFGNSDLAVFKPRIFVEGDNQFDCYHFVVPRVEVPCFYADKKEIIINKNSILPTNPGQKLRLPPINKMYSKSGDIKFICMFIAPGKLQELTKEAFNESEFSFNNETAHFSNHLLSLISNFETEFINKQFGKQFVLDSLSTEIAINLVRGLKSNLPEMQEQRRYAVRKDINLAIDFLWENYNIEFSLDSLCNIVNLSPYYFVRIFKAQTGKPPYEYYMDIKIKKALTYLKSKKHSITEIGFILGFSSNSHFTSVFKKKVGVTPSEFIKSVS